ncbi:MAG: carbohydrate-binding protein [Spirochaetales bacterium]|nr:carbohydrate-binding protein [Spirochaetales bacterium]
MIIKGYISLFIFISILLGVFFCFSCEPIQFLNELETLAESTPSPLPYPTYPVPTETPYYPLFPTPTPFPTLTPTPVMSQVDAFSYIDAISFSNASFGITTDNTCLPHITSINNNSWVMYASLDFSTLANGFYINVTTGTIGGNISIVLDSLLNTPIGMVNVNNTGGVCHYEEKAVTIQEISGVHDLYLVFGGIVLNLFDINQFKFVAQ